MRSFTVGESGVGTTFLTGSWVTSVTFNRAHTSWPSNSTSGKLLQKNCLHIHINMFKNILLVDGHQWRNG